MLLFIIIYCIILSSRLLSMNLKIKIYKVIVLPVLLYGCETYSLTLREERRLRVYENRILRQIFKPKRDESGEWRMFHNEELHGLYRSPNVVRVIKPSSPNIVRVIKPSSPNIVRVSKYRRLRWAGHVGRMEKGRRAFKM